MPHLHRFYLPGELSPGLRVSLEGDEAHHALHVVRVRAGEEVALINGRGAEAMARVASCSRHAVALVCETCTEEPRPAQCLTLAQAALHNAKAMEFVVRHGTEVGVGRFLFFTAQRSERARGGVEKLERVAVEAMKQCGRRWLPEISLVGGIAEAIAQASGCLLIASMDSEPTPLGTLAQSDAVTVLVGPEGDFTEEETALALDAGARAFSLGRFTYRAEVAALLAATIVQHARGALGPV